MSAMSITEQTPAERNAHFLAAIDSASKDSIITSIAEHYGISSQEALDEVTTDGAEHLLDYMVEPHRSAASLVMLRCAANGKFS